MTTLSITGYDVGPLLSENRGVATYRATRLDDDRPVSVRHVPQGADADSVRNVLRDYSMSKTVGPVALQAIEQIEEENGGVLVIFDRTQARSLRDLVDEGALPVARFLQAALAIVDAVSLLHAQNVIHKNLNLDSICYDEANRAAQLRDFGIASHTPHDGAMSLSKLEGSPAYISPEQTGRVNRSVDQRTDCYALGVVFYRLLTGRLPFNSMDPLELIHSHLAVQPAPASSIAPDIPSMLSTIIDKMMAKTPDARYQRLTALTSDLKECAAQWSRKREISTFVPGQHDAYNTLAIPQALYGRETELAILESALQNTIAGQNQLVLVSGEPGVGKTALVQEVRPPVAINSGYFISGKFDQYKRNIPYSAIINAFRDLVREILGEPDAELQAWRSNLMQALGDQAQIVIDVIPEVELITGPQPGAAMHPLPARR